jgi:hypothetical protein
VYFYTSASVLSGHQVGLIRHEIGCYNRLGDISLVAFRKSLCKCPSVHCNGCRVTGMGCFNSLCLARHSCSNRLWDRPTVRPGEQHSHGKRVSCVWHYPYFIILSSTPPPAPPPRPAKHGGHHVTLSLSHRRLRSLHLRWRRLSGSGPRCRLTCKFSRLSLPWPSISVVRRFPTDHLTPHSRHIHVFLLSEAM